MQKESPWRARMRYAKIGAAAVGGGALLAVTGAPLIAPNGHISMYSVQPSFKYT